jgi:hypothetical protein
MRRIPPRRGRWRGAVAGRNPRRTQRARSDRAALHRRRSHRHLPRQRPRQVPTRRPHRRSAHLPTTPELRTRRPPPTRPSTHTKPLGYGSPNSRNDPTCNSKCRTVRTTELWAGVGSESAGSRARTRSTRAVQNLRRTARSRGVGTRCRRSDHRWPWIDRRQSALNHPSRTSRQRAAGNIVSSSRDLNSGGPLSAGRRALTRGSADASRAGGNADKSQPCRIDAAVDPTGKGLESRDRRY